MSGGQRTRLMWLLGFIGLLTVVFIKPLVALMQYSAGVDMHSHIVLIPVVSVYLLALRYRSLATQYSSSPVWALVPLALGVLALGVVWKLIPLAAPLSLNDQLACYAMAYVALLMVAGFVFLGRGWMASAAFPVLFLLFMVPLPDGLVHWMETGSQLASAQAADWMFSLTGLPNVRSGNFFRLPTITIEVAEECSGIRSSWILFITSLVAAEMFLRSSWRRLILVALIIPLGVLRNGFRILVISWLCVEVGPHMIHSFIHHRGGPIFFALSLGPLFLLLWLLRRGELRKMNYSQSPPSSVTRGEKPAIKSLAS